MTSKSATVFYVALALAFSWAGPVAAETRIFFDSDPGDYIGQGNEWTYTDADGTFTATRNFDDGVDISFNGSEYWSLNFAPKQNVELIAGPYEAATRFPFQSPTGPGLSVSGDGRGCNTLTGRFDVFEAEYDGTTGDVIRFAADFVQHCEGGSPALVGEVRFNSSPEPFPAFPDTDSDAVPDTVDNCLGDPNADQADGDKDGLGDVCDPAVTNTRLYFDSDAGDYIGQGKEWAYYLINGNISAETNFDNGVSIDFEGADTWSFDFAAPEGAQLTVGSYENATRFPFQDSSVPGLSVGGAGRGCNTLTGRFDVFEVVYNGNVIERFAAEYEQHCEGGSTALRGMVVYNGSVSYIVPVLPLPAALVAMGMLSVAMAAARRRRV